MTVILDTGDELHIHLGYLPVGTFHIETQENGAQTESSWVEKTEIWPADTAGICGAGYTLSQRKNSRNMQKSSLES